MILEKLKALTSKKDRPEHVVALDIGTEYVKALIGRTKTTEEATKAAEVVGVGRLHQAQNNMISGAIADINGVVDTCDEALAKAEEMSDVVAKQAVIGIAGELVKGATITIHYERDEPGQALEQAELETIVSRVQEQARRRAQAEIGWESGKPDIEVKLVNTAIVNVYIDGYRVTNPVGFQGEEVSIELFCALAPMVHLSAIERVAFDLDLQVQSITAEPFAVAKSVGVDKSRDFSAVFIDIGGGTTDIAVVNEGGVVGTKMFGIGGRSFTRTIAKELGLSRKVAEERKIALSNNDLNPNQKKTTEKTIVKTLRVWLSGVEMALSEFDDVDQLPGDILLCGGGSGLPHITKVLETSKWRRDLPFPKEVNIEHITPSQVNRVLDKTGQIHDTDFTFITPMGLLNQALDVSGHKSQAKTALDRFNQLLKA